MNFLKDFYTNYILVNISNYPNIGIDLEINKVLLFVSLVLCVASFVISSYERNLSLLIRKLFRSGAFSADDAKTLAELGLSQSRTIKSILSKRSGITKKLISSTLDYPKSYDELVAFEKDLKKSREESEKASTSLFSTAKFYINADEKLAAENYYKTKNPSVLKTSLYCVAILVFYVIVALLMPSILEILNGLMSK